MVSSRTSSHDRKRHQCNFSPSPSSLSGNLLQPLIPNNLHVIAPRKSGKEIRAGGIFSPMEISGFRFFLFTRACQTYGKVPEHARKTRNKKSL
jgi:hypothetical protein